MRKISGWIFAISLFLVACTPEATAIWSDDLLGNNSGADTSVPIEAAETLSEVVLRNSLYQGIYDEPAQLTDGVYEGAPFVEGGASRPMIWYIDGDTVWGDIDGDGLDEAVVHLVESSGGSGNFSYLALVDKQNEGVVNTATTFLGDRISFHAVTIEAGQVVVEVTTQGPGDPFCCASQRERLTLRYEGGPTLAEVERQVILPSFSERLKNATYQLDDIDEPVVMVDGQFEGKPYVEGSASRPTATLVDLEDGSLAGIAYFVYDLNGDGQQEALVILSANLGGSGGFRYLAVVTLPPNTSDPVPLTTIFLGDRIKVTNLYAQDQEIILKLLVHGQGDGLCCPTQEAEWRFKLEGPELVRINP